MPRTKPFCHFYDLALPPVRYDSLCTIPIEVKLWLPLFLWPVSLPCIKHVTSSFAGIVPFPFRSIYHWVCLLPISFVRYLGPGVITCCYCIVIFIKSLLVSLRDVTILFLLFLKNPVCS